MKRRRFMGVGAAAIPFVNSTTVLAGALRPSATREDSLLTASTIADEALRIIRIKLLGNTVYQPFGIPVDQKKYMSIVLDVPRGKPSRCFKLACTCWDKKDLAMSIDEFSKRYISPSASLLADNVNYGLTIGEHKGAIGVMPARYCTTGLAGFKARANTKELSVGIASAYDIQTDTENMRISMLYDVFTKL